MIGLGKLIAIRAQVAWYLMKMIRLKDDLQMSIETV